MHYYVPAVIGRQKGEWEQPKSTVLTGGSLALISINNHHRPKQGEHINLHDIHWNILFCPRALPLTEGNIGHPDRNEKSYQGSPGVKPTVLNSDPSFMIFKK